MKDHHSAVKAGGFPFKGILMLAFSLGAGAAGVYLSQQYIENQVALKTVTTVVEEPMLEVVVPIRDMQRGDIVYIDDFVRRQIPAEYVDSNSVLKTNVERALGQRMDFDLDKGRPLLWAHLAGGVSPTFSGKVSAGLRAMTVRVDDINSISGFLQPNDRVDLLMSYGDDDDQRIMPLMQQLNVIATGIQTETDKLAIGEPRSFSTITVHVTPADAQKLVLAQQVGSLTAILRNPDDQSDVKDKPFSLTQLLAASEPVKPKRRAKRKVKVAKAPAIEYIIGGQ